MARREAAQARRVFKVLWLRSLCLATSFTALKVSACHRPDSARPRLPRVRRLLLPARSITVASQRCALLRLPASTPT